MENFLKDLRFAVRTLRKQPAFTATAVATLALAIGAATAIFSIVESTLLRPLPFQSPDRIGVIQQVAGPQRASRGVSYPEALDWARMQRAFDVISVYDETSLNIRTPLGADRVEAEMVSAGFFGMLGVSAAHGRVFTAAEDRVPDANPVVVISDVLWKTRFNGDAGIIGRPVILNDLPFTVLGVMPPGFKGASFDTDLWFPAAMVHANGGPTDLTDRGSRWYGAMGRLRAGTTQQQGQADLDRVAAQLARDFPESNRDRGIDFVPLRTSYLGSTRALLLAVFGGASLLLLIACANVIGLQLVRSAARQREMALRMAIGANRARLVQQLMGEGLVVAGASAAAGILVAYWGLNGLVALAPPGVLPAYAVPTINVTALLFAVLVAAGSGFFVGLIPALRGSRIDLVDALKQGSRGAAQGFGGRGRLGAQQLLVIGETSVALVLLIGAGLFVRSLERTLAVAPGFDPRGVLRARIVVPPRYTPEMRGQFVNQIQERLLAIPSMQSVAIGSDLPLIGATSASFVYLPERPQSLRFYRHIVAPGYFDALRIRLTSGREFNTSDRAQSPLVVMINESMARRFWPNANPIGARLRLGDPAAPEATVVGVVADVRYRDLTTPLATTEPDIYIPIAQRPPADIQIAVRSDAAPEPTVAAMRREIAAIDPTIPLFRIQPLESVLAQQTASGRFASSLLSVFGAAALLLTAIGLYGLLAFLVSLRRREIGIRLALGATNNRVLGSIMGQGMRLVAIGLVIGVVGAASATKWIATQLYGVGAHDPLVFVAIPLVLLGVAAMASALPARRASRVDPQIALRSE